MVGGGNYQQDWRMKIVRRVVLSVLCVVIVVALLCIVLLVGRFTTYAVHNTDETYPEYLHPVVDQVLGHFSVCFDNPLQRFFIVRVKITDLEVAPFEREPLDVPSDKSELRLHLNPAYGISDFSAILRIYSLYSIPIGYSKITNNEIQCTFGP